jgi:diguanylate cyclase (GGDEF)-like protein
MLEVRLLYKELAQYSRAQQELALHDALTGLPNRRLLEDRIETALQHANRNHHKAAVMYLDLDGFKAINDTYGHAYGDEVLKMVSQRLLSNSRKEDTVARLGGDEFIVLLGDIHSLADAQGPAAKLVEALSEPFFINDLTLQLSTSIGISMYPDDAENVTDLISIADYALYEAKRAGKNRFCANGNAARQAAQAVKPGVPQLTPSAPPELAQHR